MAIKAFTSFDALFKHLQKEATKTLQQKDSNVENVVVTEFIESIKDNAYDVYQSPARYPYERQMEHGGLIDRSNFRNEPTSDGIAISSSRRGVDGNGNPVDVLEVLEGNAPWGVQDVWGYGFEQERNVVEPVRDKLGNSKHLTNAMRLDLQNKGFDVE